MAELESIDYPTVALSLLIERFKDSEDFKKILGVAMDASMELQTTMFEINELFVLETAQGPELTVIGHIWDVSRKLNVTETDDGYRIRIQVKAVLSISGTVSEIKQMLLSFYGATYVEYHGAFPAGYSLLTDAEITTVLLNQLTAAGVQGFLGVKLPALTFSYPLGELSVLRVTL